MSITNPKSPTRGIWAAAGPRLEPDAKEATRDVRRFARGSERTVGAAATKIVSPRAPTSLRDVLSCPEPVEGYPLERAELVLLARHWAAMSLELSLSSFLRGKTGPTELGLHRLAAERLGRIGQLLGEGAIVGAVAEADSECREALGERLWDL